MPTASLARQKYAARSVWSSAAAKAGAQVDTVTLDAGHALMTEQPDATLDALYTFATQQAPRVGNG